MKLQNKKMKLSVLLIATLIIGLATYVYSEQTGLKNVASAETTQELALTRPAFSADATAMSTFLNQEAGMAIWLNDTAYAPLSLNAAKGVITAPENVTSDYVIGSIPLQAVGFSSDDSPHAFVHRSGWIVVYWLKINTANPSTTGWLGKTFPLYGDTHHTWYDKSSHLLDDNLLNYALVLLCQALSVPSSGAQYYHFQYPSATKLEIAIRSALANGGPGTATFNIKIPSTLTMDEQSWSCYISYGGSVKIDQTTIPVSGGRSYGDIATSPSNPLTPDVWHTVTITASTSSGYSSDITTFGLIMLYH